MGELTLEGLAKRVETLERMLKVSPPEDGTPRKDWRRAVGMFTGSEFMKQVDAEGQAIRERDRDEAEQEGL
ncbi:MAG TPA: hypothetical protein VHR72_03025 [Gemmataceae bacterium]|jgi:hypothetical protein|nr:hypothetical protein [Gemmataceae bacterium]